ncbi:hypothetical protein DIURU_005432 [Diutina rugosa]|uniref:Dynein heavy chain, cytoplasmic n=1 Tax=Diutina rugosa TaxID=5481 RepID=A0A642UK07_DIURU|nr:uncharacterized protein DIURU_005432 [Diutina rugosa]KAA8896919.1 hypothetical protein DIURU_005432 [Diutina rugosa]
MDLETYLRQVAQLNGPDVTLDISDVSSFRDNPNHDAIFLVRHDNRVVVTTAPANNTFSDEWCSAHSVTAVIKGLGPITTPERQLRVVVVPSGKDMDALSSMIRMGLAPMFDAWNGDSVLGNATKKKFGELSLSLQHLNSGIIVPDLKSASLKLSTEEKPQDPVNDTEYLNKLTSVANQWISDIREVTKLDHNPRDGQSLADDVAFWKAMDQALASINHQKSQPYVTEAIEVLTQAKRFQITTAFKSETGLITQQQRTDQINSVLKDIPLAEMQAVTPDDGIDSLESAISLVFTHISHRLSSSEVALDRMQAWIELLISDVVKSINQFIIALKVLEMSPDTWRTTQTAVKNLQQAVDQNLKYAINEVRGIVRRRSDKFVQISIDTQAWDQFNESFQEICELRASHDELSATLIALDAPLEYQTKLSEAYNSYMVLITPFTTQWKMNLSLYYQQAKQVRQGIVTQLSLVLNQCREFSDYVSVVSRLGGVHHIIPDEYRTRLLDQAASEVGALNSLQVYRDDKVVPRAKNILCVRSQVEYYSEGLTAILGSTWGQYSVGGKIRQLLNEIDDRLAAEGEEIQRWIKQVEEKLARPWKGPLIRLVMTRTTDLVVNCDHSLVESCVSLHQLHRLGFDISKSTTISATRVLSTFGNLAIGLSQHLVAFKLYAAKKSYSVVEPIKREIIAKLKKCQDLQWDNIDDELVASLESQIADYCGQVSKLDMIDNAVDNEIARLQQCPFDDESISSIKNSVYKLDIERIKPFVDQRVQSTLTAKGQFQLNSISAWLGNSMDATFHEDSATEYWGLPIKHDSMELKVLTRDQQFVVEPSFALVRQQLYGFVNHILNQAPQANASPVLMTIDSIVAEAETYIDRLNSLQLLWELDLSRETDLARLFGGCQGVSLQSWMKVMDEMMSLRSIIDGDSSVWFGEQAIRLDYGAVVSRVNLKFDRFFRDFLERFAAKVQENSTKFLNEIKDAKRNLGPRLNLHQDVVLVMAALHQFVTVDAEISRWSQQLAILKKAQSILVKNRFQFPEIWSYCEQLEGKFTEVTDLISKKRSAIDADRDGLIVKVTGESERVAASLQSLHRKWSSKKPVSGQLDPGAALATLATFRQLCANLSMSITHLSVVAQLMSVSVPQLSVDAIRAEIDGHHSVWVSLDALWTQLNGIKTTPWGDVNPRTVRKQLDDLSRELRSLPTNTKQYAAYDELTLTFSSLLKYSGLISDLKGDALKTRHWKQLLPKVNVEDLTLGHVWDLLIAPNNEAMINEVLIMAQNEHVIEAQLAKIQLSWVNTTFELVPFGKYRLIANWDALFDQCTRDISALASMRSSSYFASFEREITQLETKLSEIYGVLDLWIDVQQQWVYLSGVFSGGGEIAQLLPVESARFSNILTEYTSLTKRLFKVGLVWDITSAGDLTPVMKRFLDQLNRIRRSLITYLEQQRQHFPRFYFVGNDDLLAMIGDSSVAAVNRHVSQMFGGIRQLTMEDSRVVGWIGDWGETVMLKEPVSLVHHPRLDEWLTAVERGVKLTISDCISYHLGKDPVELALSSDVPTQVIVVVTQIGFTKATEDALKSDMVAELKATVIQQILKLTQAVNVENSSLRLHRIEHVLIELLHQRAILDTFSQSGKDWWWNGCQRFYHIESNEPLERVLICQATSKLTYGFEYIGVPEKLAYTPLVDRCFLAMSQALSQGLGGSPFGPAGTGKTETVKALAHNCGRMVLVFNCDESFDMQSMSRIFLGLCRIGIWGCFDEFNRLDERMLSAVSSQIEAIEHGLRGDASEVEISGVNVEVSRSTGIFVTMNPRYAGRSQLPENLKKLFWSFSMDSPDHEVIVEVLLSSQGFGQAHTLAKLIVPLFLELQNQASQQAHYDFGLRALKSTLTRCGQIKRSTSGDSEKEDDIVVRAIEETVTPRLVKVDRALLSSLLNQYFPDTDPNWDQDREFLSQLHSVAAENHLTVDKLWAEKATQLFHIESSHAGIILVGESGSGKSTVWRSVLKAVDASASSYIIDAKVMSKDQLYGRIDPVTRDWSDGLLTKLIRKIGANLRGERSHRHWIIFDGDIDPIWAENLNSVLDDNRILTLANGERLSLPPEVRLVFEVDSLRYATPATISRCGMIWFDEGVVSVKSRWNNLLGLLSTRPIDEDQGIGRQMEAVTILSEIISDTIWESVVNITAEALHIMPFSVARAFSGFQALLQAYISKLVVFEAEHGAIVDVKQYMAKAVGLSLSWSFAGDINGDRDALGKRLTNLIADVDLESSPFVVDVNLPEAEWAPWTTNASQNSIADIEPYQINSSMVIPTAETACHQQLIHTLLHQHCPLVLCGPPGSGKTMTLLAALRASPQFEVVALNFSKDTSVASILRSLEQHCVVRRRASGLELAPKVSGTWVVVFCDEINLPQPDQYGTQHVISFLRQMVEQRGFWNRDDQWVSLGDIQFVGACNPPTDPGRQPLSLRMLRHVALVVVDYPRPESMAHIYGSFVAALLKCAPTLKSYGVALTNAMIDIYQRTKDFMTGKMSHYVYSPRELTRWCQGMFEVITHSEVSTVSQLVRLWYHEGVRLFSDRLVDPADIKWQHQTFVNVVSQYFPMIDVNEVCKDPVLYSDWLSLNYEPVQESELRSFLTERLRVFAEEEVDVDLVLHEDVLDHCLRLDRVLRQPQGHMILVGDCASGKTTLTRFVAWINGLKSIQLQVDRDFGVDRFDRMLRELLLRCARGERVCFIIDESSILDPAFIERMNTLLANSEVPGLFMGEDMTSLMSICLEQSQAQGLLLDSEAELYQWFCQQITRNLHVVFTISPESAASVISSPALFNRCVLNWMGSWSDESYDDVAQTTISASPIDIKAASIAVAIHAQYGAAPAQFMAFLSTILQVYRRTMSGLEDHHRHVTQGLDQLRETVIKVQTLQSQLATQRTQLEEKNAQKDAALEKLFKEQTEIERKREFAITASEELEKHKAELEARRLEVMFELQKVEPEVEAARKGVSDIKMDQINEIRRLNRPPDAVKMTIESVCVLLGYDDVSSWPQVLGFIRKNDFIASIVNFDVSLLEDNRRTFLEENYLSRPDYTFEAAQRASKACGPLLRWVLAQFSYASIISSVAPLEKEMTLLENKNRETSAQLEAIEEIIQELQVKCNLYERDYSEVIRETESIKTQMKEVSKKVERSQKLLLSLRSEKDRWKINTTQFASRREQVIGDAILAASFSVYGTALDQRGRYEFETLVKQMLSQYALPHSQGYTFRTLMPKVTLPSGVVNDTVTIDNWVSILTNERPLVVVDPTGSVLHNLTTGYSTNTAVVSALAPDMVSRLENALRYGGRLVITDIEFYDPILNPVFRGEVYRSGGKTMIMLGDAYVDYSPSFRLVVHTKDSSIPLPQFVKSRATIINFTLTPASLENKLVDMIVEHVRPDVAERRQQCVAQRGEIIDRLLQLEQNLLELVSGSEGSLLDNDEVVSELEKLKTEMSALDARLSDAGQVMTELDGVRLTYEQVAHHSRAVYDVCQMMAAKSDFYEVDLDAFIHIFQRVLSGGEMDSFVERLYQEVYAVASPAMVYADKVAFATGLTMSKLGEESDETKQVKTILEGLANGKSPMNSLDAFNKPLWSADGPYSSTYDLDKSLAMYSVVLIASPGGVDATTRIEALAEAERAKLTVISMGSKEGVEAANLAMSAAEPGWVLLQNIQMAPNWLSTLDKQLSGLPNNRKVIMTCSLSSKIPRGVIVHSQVISYEAPPSLRHSIRETYKLLSTTTKVKHAEFLLVLFHAIICERMKFVPNSFNQTYDINDADFASALAIIQGLNGKPWDEIAYMVGVISYGSKIDNVADFDYVVTLAKRLFSNQSTQPSFNVLSGSLSDDMLALPQDDDYDNWIRSIPAVTPMTWIDLEEKVLDHVQARDGKQIAELLFS